MSVVVCDTETSSRETLCRSYATLDPVLSDVRISSLYATNASISYMSTTIGSLWSSSGGSVCMTVPKGNYVIRAASAPKPGATVRLMGTLRDTFPELGKLSEEDLEHLLRRMRG